MEKQPKPEKIYIEKIEKIWGPVLSFITAILALPIAIKEIIDGNNKNIAIIATSLFAVVIISLLLYVATKKNKKTEEGTTEKTWRYQKKYRLLAIITMALLIIGSIAGGLTYHLQRQRKLIVAIANFDGPEEVYGMRNEIMDSLRNDFYGEKEIIFETIEKVITPNEGSEIARKLGNKIQADLVLWGWYRPAENTNMTINMEFLEDFEEHTVNQKQVIKPTVKLDELESFSFQKKIGQETSALVTFLKGFIEYLNNNNRKAIELEKRYMEIVGDSDIYKNQLSAIEIIIYASYRLFDNETMIEYANIGIEMLPDQSEFFNYRGVAYSNLGNYEKALEDFNKAEEVYSTTQVSFNRGVVYLELEKYNKAIEEFTEAISNNDEKAIAYAHRGYAYYKQEDYEKALKDLEIAIKLDPKYSDNYLGRAKIYLLQNKCSLSLIDLNKAIRVGPKKANYYTERGLTNDCLERYDRAINDYTKAIKIDPTNPDPYYFRGRDRLEYKKDYTGALEDFTKANELKPEDVAGVLYIARTLFKLEDYDKAIEGYTRVINEFAEEIKEDDQYPSTFYERGSAYYYAGNYEKAIIDYTKAIDLEYVNVHDAYLGRATSYYEMGDKLRTMLDLARYEKLTGIKYEIED